jgi:chromosome segregation ATPase
MLRRRLAESKSDLQAREAALEGATWNAAMQAQQLKDRVSLLEEDNRQLQSNLLHETARRSEIRDAMAKLQAAQADAQAETAAIKSALSRSQSRETATAETLASVLNSRTWRMMAPYRWFAERLRGTRAPR